MPRARTTPAAIPPTRTPVFVFEVFDWLAAEVEDDAARDAEDEWRTLSIIVSIWVTAVGLVRGVVVG